MVVEPNIRSTGDKGPRSERGRERERGQDVSLGVEQSCRFSGAVERPCLDQIIELLLSEELQATKGVRCACVSRDIIMSGSSR